MSDPIVCELCGRVLQDAAQLVTHYELTHPRPATTWFQPRLPFGSDRVHRVSLP